MVVSAVKAAIRLATPYLPFTPPAKQDAGAAILISQIAENFSISAIRPDTTSSSFGKMIVSGTA